MLVCTLFPLFLIVPLTVLFTITLIVTLAFLIYLFTYCCYLLLLTMFSFLYFFHFYNFFCLCFDIIFLLQLFLSSHVHINIFFYRFFSFVDLWSHVLTSSCCFASFSFGTYFVVHWSHILVLSSCFNYSSISISSSSVIISKRVKSYLI